MYLPVDMIAEMEREAKRQHRSLSAIVQMAWRRARGRIREMPGEPPEHRT
jgi:uncharacterized small protein (TIGR04563 family)